MKRIQDMLYEELAGQVALYDHTITVGGRGFGQTDKLRRLIEPHEKPSKLRVDAFKPMRKKIDLIEGFNKQKHLATCAKNRRKRKSKKRRK